MEPVYLLFYAGVAFVLGAILRGVTAPREGEGLGATIAVVKQLVAEHLSLARDRLSAAEARLALLEERVAFHEGFTRPPPAPGPAADLPRPTLRVLRFPSSGRDPNRSRNPTAETPPESHP